MRAALVAALALLLVAGAAVALDRPEAKVLRFTNARRADHDLVSLTAGPRLTRAAEKHAQRMADRGSLFHGDYVRSGCWGQNIGVGPSVWAVFRAWMHSPDHRANVLGRCYRRAGVGVVRVDGAVWVVENFAG